jgi:hypothetical protein
MPEGVRRISKYREVTSYFNMLLHWLMIIVVLIHWWCAALSLFYRWYFCDMFPSYKAIIRKVLLRKCCAVLPFLVHWSRTSLKLVPNYCWISLKLVKTYSLDTFCFQYCMVSCVVCGVLWRRAVVLCVRSTFRMTWCCLICIVIGYFVQVRGPV